MTTMRTLPVTEFKAHCLETLNQVAETGEPVLLTKRGNPTVMVCVPPQVAESVIRFGLFENQGKIVGGILAPFDEPWDSGF